MTDKCPECNAPLHGLHLRCNDRLAAAVRRAELAEAGWAKARNDGRVELAELRSEVELLRGELQLERGEHNE